MFANVVRVSLLRDSFTERKQLGVYYFMMMMLASGCQSFHTFRTLKLKHDKNPLCVDCTPVMPVATSHSFPGHSKFG